MISFEQATAADATLISELAKTSWQSAYSNILSPAQIEYMLELMYAPEVLTNQLNSENYRYFLVRYADETAGFIGFERHIEPLTTKLQRLYLLEDFKGKKLGKAALSFLEETVLANGDLRIILNVNKNNPAKLFYESQGYKVYGEGVFDIGGGFVMDDYLMEKQF